MAETILQAPIVTDFALPFLLIFFILYGILEKTKVFGGDSHRTNALVSFVVGLIFVAAVEPKLIVENLTLFLTIAIVVVFIALLLWGFVSGGEAKIPEGIQKPVGGLVVLAVAIATLWAVGAEGKLFDLIFRSSWSADFWTNFAFIAVVVVALVLVIGGKSKS